ncbi:MAG: hypothetical protein KKA65_06280 [Nanoarchaeota archaeon]|nr:hypothetical protein [Nanoarchaeota archaeon]
MLVGIGGEWEKYRTHIDGRIHIYDVQTSEELSLIEQLSAEFHTGISGKAYFLDDQTIAVQENIWHLPLVPIMNPANISTRYYAAAYVNTFVLSPDRRRMAVAYVYNNNFVLLYDLSNDAEPIKIVGHRGGVSTLNFSNQGEWLATAGFDKWVSIWKASNGSIVRSVDVQTYASSILFSPDDSLVILGTWDGYIIVLSMNDYSIVQKWQARWGTVTSLAFTPDGSMLISGSSDGTVRFWQMPEATSLRSLEGYSSISSMAISPDGRSLVFGTTDGVVEVWGVAR